jgi:hypothetical protein
LSLIGASILAVAGRHQHAQKIEMLFGLAAAPLDQLGDQLGERAKAEREFQIAVLFLGDDFEGIGAELRSSAPDRCRRSSAARSPGQLAGVVGEVDRLAARGFGRPALREFLVDLVDQALNRSITRR